MPARRNRFRTAATAAVAAGVALVVVGCGADEPAAPKQTAGMVHLDVDGRQRSYLLEPAVGLAKNEKSALVVVLHQEGGTPAGVAKETALQELRQAGATLAYPAGVQGSWDAGNCCGVPRRQNIDDVRFVDAVIKDAGERVAVDRRREALVGYSSGGMLTYRYVCARPGRLAAAVVVSGSLESRCDERITVPDVLTVHGKLDGTIGLTRPIFIGWLGLAPRPAASTLGILTSSAGCDPSVASRSGGVEVRRWAGCRGGTVEALLVPKAGHGWGSLDASRRTLGFLHEQLLSD